MKDLTLIGSIVFKSILSLVIKSKDRYNIANDYGLIVFGFSTIVYLLFYSRLQTISYCFDTRTALYYYNYTFILTYK